jgi:hypothetical protein
MPSVEGIAEAKEWKVKDVIRGKETAARES